MRISFINSCVINIKNKNMAVVVVKSLQVCILYFKD